MPPAYDYKCDSCGKVKEVFHSISESPRVGCACGKAMRKAVSGFYLGGATLSAKDRSCVADMQSDMRENYGVEKFSPVGGASVSDIYRDVKSQGSLVRDQMQAKKEINERKQREKIREWKKGALARTPQRAKEKIERRKREEAQKRRVAV